MYIKSLIKRKALYSFFSFFIIGLIVVGTSDALFTNTMSNPVDQSLAVGNLLISFERSATIDNENLKPMTDIKGEKDPNNLYTFTITNTGSVANHYELRLKDNPDYDTSLLLVHDYIRYKLNDKAPASMDDGETYIGNGVIEPGESISYSLKVWVKKEGLPNEANGKEVHLNIMVNSEVIYDPGLELADGEPNQPALTRNLLPVVYDEVNDTWVMSSGASDEWYDYANQKWANAVTIANNEYNKYKIGDAIPMSDIVAFWVWIPRFEYYINGQFGEGGTSLTAPGAINIHFIKGMSKENSEGYLIHPAFRDGAKVFGTVAYDAGGFSRETTGFWIGKFETGSETIYKTTHVNETEGVLVKPNVYSMKYQTFANQLLTAEDFDDNNSIFPYLTSSILKNDEWGAVTYLSQSTYGKFGNSDYIGLLKEVFPNNAYYATGYIYTTGRSAGVQSSTSSAAKQYGTYEYNNCPATAYTKTDCTYDVRVANATKGTGASTTGNIYGVYDMAGGAREVVFGNFNNNVASSGYTAFFPEQNYNKYTTTALATQCNGVPCKGLGYSDEVGNGSIGGNYLWYSDYISALSTGSSWVGRGYVGASCNSVACGIFSSIGTSGASSTANSFRIVLRESEYYMTFIK